MSKVYTNPDNYENIADAIRTKLDSEETYKPAEMSAAILSIETDPEISALNVTENGTYTAPEGVDGYSPVNVNVASEVVVEPITITENGTYTAPEGVDGYSPVNVNVTSGGVIEPITITENGTYTAEEGVDGYSPITVTVPGGGGAILPFEYQEVEYIQPENPSNVGVNDVNNAANCYFNTGFYANNNTDIEVKFDITYSGRIANGSQVIIGSRQSYTGNMFVLYIPTNGGCGINVSPRDVQIGTPDSYPAVVRNAGTYWYINNTKVSVSSYYTFQSSSPYQLQIFAFSDRGNMNNRQADARLYYAKIWDNGTLVRNFIPCYRKADNVPGLYDIVNNTFYTGAGSGSFIVGPDVVPGTPSIGNKVYFNDTQGTTVEIVDIASGFSVVNPNLTVDGTRIQSKNWKDNQENIITFPYTPATDITLQNVEAVNYAYIINPAGTTPETIITHPDGSASTFTRISGRNPTIRTGEYTEAPTSGYETMQFNTLQDRWKYGGYYTSSGYNVAMYSNLMDCSSYNRALFKVLPYYVGGWGAQNIYLATRAQNNWYPAESFASYNLGSSTYTASYYRNLYGSSWTYANAAKDLTDPAWQDWIVDITNLDSFYLWLHFCDGGGLVAYAYLYNE